MFSDTNVGILIPANSLQWFVLVSIKINYRISDIYQGFTEMLNKQSQFAL